MNCELCGKQADLKEVLVEGTRMRLCASCAHYGKVLEAPARPARRSVPSVPRSYSPEPARNNLVQALVDDFSNRIKRRRESMGLKQEELAKRINIKASLLHSIESGKFKPSIELARVLEKALRVQLVEQQEQESASFQGTTSEGMTIGDLLKKKT